MIGSVARRPRAYKMRFLVNAHAGCVGVAVELQGKHNREPSIFKIPPTIAFRCLVKPMLPTRFARIFIESSSFPLRSWAKSASYFQ